ncbi:MAG: DUF1028 domain-containing protein [Pseudonocardiales bacterium]|nr:DUF1028 domain-containing protein [Pseudonocardiales bacterium]
MTYSILGRDRATGDVGAAVQSAWYSAGAGVLWVEAGIGAVATQAIGERAFGHLGLQMMTAGSAPTQVVASLVAGDVTPGVRQIGVIDLSTTPAAFTGSDCVPNAEHQPGADCVAQANMMTSPGVPEAMVAAFEAGAGDLTDRLLAALDAAQALGGDFRGMQSAGLVVRTGERGAPAWTTALVNVRVDDHREPLAELRRLAGLSRAYRNSNLSLERLASGDHSGAVEAARDLCSHVAGDLNARMRLGLTLAAGGDPEGAEILGAMAEQSGRWLAYARSLCLRYGIDPQPILDRLR